MFKILNDSKESRWPNNPKMNAEALSVPKPLTYDYMPDGYPSKSVQTETIMEEQEVAFADHGGLYVATNTVNFVPILGKIYKIKFDGVEYKCEAKKIPGSTDKDPPCLGNLSIVVSGGEDTGEPFIYANEGFWAWITPNAEAEHTIGVDLILTPIKTMAEEFMPQPPVFYFTPGLKTLYDENGTAITIEQIRAAGINAILCPKGSDGKTAYFRPIYFYSNGTNNAYYTVAAKQDEWYTAGFFTVS